MKDKTSKTNALKASIKHWQANVQACKDEELEQIDISWAGCQLCLCYYKEECYGCPVSKKTGQAKCNGTPYDQVGSIVQVNQTELDDVPWEDLEAACQKMLEFLQDLLPQSQVDLQSIATISESKSS